jgi:predicted ATPase
LGIPVGDGYPALNLSPQRQKQRTLEVLIEQLAGLARERPVLVLYEDVHWVDPSTLELLDLLIERVRALPALVVLTFRPEFSPPWTGQGHVTALPLNRLGRRQGATIVAQLTKGKPLPTEVQEEIVARTDGIPLFVEELTKTVLESGLLEDSGDHYELGGSLPSLAIPTTLHDSLMARLDRHAPVKEVAQIGAVIGREFSHDLLAAVAPLSDGNLTATLDQLVTSELISRRGAPPKVTYAFKHALVQDVAYQSLLRSKRHQIHARIARALEDHFPTVAAAQPEVIARHLTEAGQSETAIPYWRAAGQHAAERSAFKEAAADIDRGLALLASLPDSAERSGLETGLRLVLGSIQTATKGPAAPEVGQTYARARECCRESGDDAELFAITWNLWHFHAHGSGPHLEEARRLAEELLTIARQRSDPALLLQAHHAAWTTCSRVPGLLATCRDHAEQGVKLYDREQHRTHRFIYGGHDPGVCCRYIGAWASWLLGYPDHAIARATEALDLAEDLAHPLSAILAQSYLSFLHYCRREQGRTWACADRAMALCDEHSIAPHYLAAGRILQGWVLADRGEVDAGLAEAREGLLAFRSTGVTLYLAFILAVLADACGSAGQIEQGLEAVAEALEVIEETGERVWEAEIHRRTGMLLAAQGVEHWPNAEACYERALEVARAQDVKSLELRAATSLAQLWREQGKRTEAQSLLAPIHDWFTEGFDTADLRNAKALLDELS